MLWLCLAMLSLARRSQKTPREVSVETVIVNCFSLSAAAGAGGFPLQTRQQGVARGGYAAARPWGASALRVSKEQRGERVQLCKKKKKFPDDQSEKPEAVLVSVRVRKPSPEPAIKDSAAESKALLPACGEIIRT